MKGVMEGMEENRVKIKWIECENLETGLKIDHIDFFDDITLLVGLSGAGKTQILDIIDFSLSLALDKAKVRHAFAVNICIDINEHIYEWSYTLQKQVNKTDFSFEGTDEYFFENESLFCDRKEIFIRTDDNLRIQDFTNIPTPRKDKSLIYQYSDDLHFKELVDGLKQLYNIDMDLDVRRYLSKDSVNNFKPQIEKVFQKQPNTNIKTFSHLPTPLKLYISKYHSTNVYDRIFEVVNDIFPEIEDIDIVADETRDIYCVQIQVYGKKINQGDISNGMLKSIYFIIELYTASENSLIMIDEFENGLGMNCITPLSDLLMEERADLQFIITSHHPKIIGNIDYNAWRIIERDKNVIHNYDCNSPGYNFNNRHDAYYNLVNKWAYEGKIQ